MIAETLISTFGLEGQTAVVTGAASGIGKATAHLFASVGACVVVADLHFAAAQEVASEIASKHGRAIGVECDVSDEIAVSRMIRCGIEHFGSVEVLVNNAAYRPKVEFMDMTVEQWDRMHHVNTRGTFLCMREVIRYLKGAGKSGSIVNIASVNAIHPTAFCNTHYDSSKAGVLAITRTSAIEFAPDKIRVNAILPGGTDTEGSRTAKLAGVQTRGPIRNGQRFPMGRIAQPIELANAILFLASPAASYVTGQSLVVDGGYSVS